MSIGCYGTSSKQPTWCPRNCTCDGEKISVSCKDSNFTEIPPDLPTSVRILELSQNKLKKISNRTFIKFQNLTSLSLNENEISVIEKDAFKGLDNLQRLWELILDKNSISSIQGGIFADVSSLQILRLSYNRLQYIDERTFSGLDHLSFLSLNNFGLKDADPDVFQGLQSLRTLNLMNNELRVINASSFPLHFLENITRLYLANNPFECSCELFWFKNWINE
ncbi:hypothetical protein CAPTEDRAFT_138319, partial [Capitella teleta]